MSTPNDLYQPFGRLDHYQYKETDGSLYIVVSIKARLRQGEFLEIKEKAPAFNGSYTQEINFIIKGEGQPDTYYLCEHKPELVLIKSGMPYTQLGLDDLSKKLEDIKDQIKEMLKVPESDPDPSYNLYSITTNIITLEGAIEGTVTNTISKDEEVEIL